jgi:serine protease Do
MTRIRNYGPSVVLVVTVLAVLLGGPTVMRQLVYADQEARIQLVADQLESSPLAQLSRTFRLVGERVEPSVVHIRVSRNAEEQPESTLRGRGFPQSPEDIYRWFRERRENPGERDERPDPGDEGMDQYNLPRKYGSGSGWVYDKKGHIVTNYHVVRGADVIEVKFHDKSTRKATLVGHDEKTDIAVLKVEEDRLHPAAVAKDIVHQGDIVFAFGSPFEFEFSMSQGIVSGKGRRLGILDKFDEFGRRIQAGYENFIQTDAAINPGNSGGPLTNIHGEVVGMNTAIATRTGASNGLGFAIPSDMIRNVVDQIIDKGKVSRGYLGVWIDDLDPRMAESFGFEGKGVLVQRLAGEESPAAKAGIEAGDIVTKIDGKAIASAGELRRVVAVLQPGQTAKVTVFRDGKTKTLDVTLTEQPDDLASGKPDQIEPEKVSRTAMEPLRKLGIEKLGEVTEELAERLKLTKGQGVAIMEVRPGSVAAGQALRPGSVITRVMGKKVDTAKELTDAIADVDLAKGVRMRIVEQESERFVLLALPKD